MTSPMAAIACVPFSDLGVRAKASRRSSSAFRSFKVWAYQASRSFSCLAVRATTRLAAVAAAAAAAFFWRWAAPIIRTMTLGRVANSKTSTLSSGIDASSRMCTPTSTPTDSGATTTSTPSSLYVALASHWLSQNLVTRSSKGNSFCSFCLFTAFLCLDKASQRAVGRFLGSR